MKKQVATCDFCPAPGAHEIYFVGGHVVDICATCVAHPVVAQIVRVSDEAAKRNAERLFNAAGGLVGWQNSR